MKKKIYIAYIVLSLIGFAVSLYLTVEHFLKSQGACDFNATVSCSLVNTSIYSEILGIPVAIFGLLWFVALFLLAWQAYTKKDKKQQKRLLYWNIGGFLFVVYLIIAKILLKVICPLCTAVHVIVLVALGLSIYSYKNNMNNNNIQ